ncbi:hypothetical protein VKT23_017478 [Stygiomarasmius scandens]|uniref:Uncharacterized protein n=1 Tax=Marasmiellus scandens TaxID=2682957 RepID=A0ABR1IRY3_9AGAR
MSNDPPPSWLENTRLFRRRLQKLTNEDPPQYMESIYQKYKASITHIKRKNVQAIRDDQDILNKPLAKLYHLQKLFGGISNEALNAVGVCEVYREVDNVEKDIDRLVKWLEQLLMLAMEDPLTLVKLHSANKLLYQK